MDEVRRTTRLVTIRFYVRPSRTLVTQSVQHGVGGPGSGLWAGGGRMGLGGADVAEVPPEHLPGVLLRGLLTPDSVIEMSRDERAAWVRSWRPQGAH